MLALDTTGEGDLFEVYPPLREEELTSGTSWKGTEAESALGDSLSKAAVAASDNAAAFMFENTDIGARSCVGGGGGRRAKGDC